MNFNTLSSYQGGTLRNQIASQTLASVTETEFLLNTDSGTGTIALLTVPSGASIGGSSNPQDPNINSSLLFQGGREALPTNASRPAHSAATFDKGRPFLLRLSGVCTPASNAGNTFALTIYCGTTKAGVALATTGNLTGSQTTTAAASFVMETECIWDSSSQQITGQFWYATGFATPGYHVWAINSNAATGIALAGLTFCASAKWGNAVGGVVAVSEFSLNQI